MGLLFSLPAMVHRLLAGRRRRALHRIAHQFGLDYASTDLFGLVDHRFDLFNIADSARSENVVWGRWDGVEIKAAELWFDSGRRGAFQAAMGLAQNYSFAFAELRAWVPHLKIQRGVLAGVADDVGLDRIRVESDAFNRQFNVVCADREFAYRFLDTRMLLWLLDVARHYPVEFEVSGRKLLAYMPRIRPGQLPVLFGLAKGFHDHVPRMVLREYAVAEA